MYIAPPAVACGPCSAGTYSGAGATVCSNCTVGTYSAPGAPTCTTCADGLYSGNAAPNCSACQPGSYCVGGLPYACPAGSGGRGGNARLSDCQTCALQVCSGQVGGSVAVTVACPANSATRVENATSVGNCTCVPGFFANPPNGQACGACPAGTYAPSPGASACVPCAAGNYSAPAATVCVQCATHLLFCATQCAAGTFWAVNATACGACPVGTYSPSAATACTRCATGAAAFFCPACNTGTAYAPAVGATACLQCPPYSLASLDGTRCLCAPGTVMQASQCVPCADQSVSPAWGGIGNCSYCPWGIR